MHGPYYHRMHLILTHAWCNLSCIRACVVAVSGPWGLCRLGPMSTISVLSYRAHFETYAQDAPLFGSFQDVSTKNWVSLIHTGPAPIRRTSQDKHAQ